MQAAKLLNGASAPRILCSVANHLRYLRAPIWLYLIKEDKELLVWGE